MALTIVAKIMIQPEKVEFVKGEMLKLIPPTREEKGCIFYNLHQDNNEPSHMIWVESWETTEDWQAHNNSEHIASYRQATGEFVVGREIMQMTQVG